MVESHAVLSLLIDFLTTEIGEMGSGPYTKVCTQETPISLFCVKQGVNLISTCASHTEHTEIA